MTIQESNEYIAKYIGLKKKSDNKTWELTPELSKIFKVKSTQCLQFQENLEALAVVIKKIAKIKELWITTQYSNNSVYIFLGYKGKCIEGSWGSFKFSCERNKPLDKIAQAQFEVISTFCGWYFNNPECQTELEYELDYVKFNEQENENIIYMKPKQYFCPRCKKYYDEKNNEEDKKNDK